ncbi:hypothetical protein MMC06_001535 [Schaereria dolodes]|nr:hypothetical protein [Schaereria dolodes]
MPLHLLGKKSWNVYNTDNIEKVRRDEATAAAREAEEEQRMQEVDAERRIQILRGLRVSPLPLPSTNEDVVTGSRIKHDAGVGRERKRRRRIYGEDDTERDIRIAREDQAVVPANLKKRSPENKGVSSAPLTDRSGHINLFPAEESRHNRPKNKEAEAEAAKKKKEFEDQYTMRFSNAGGFKQKVGQKPWYHSLEEVEGPSEEAAGKDVWGNKDPRRKEREKMREVANDPLALIQKGVQGLREVEKERRKWKEERDFELKELADMERQRQRWKKRSNKPEDMYEFKLDAPAKKEGRKRHRQSHEKPNPGHRHRSRSHSRNRSYSNRESGRPKTDPSWEPGPGGRYSSQYT